MPPLPEPVMHREYKWNAFDGLALYGQSWSPAEPKALICLVHGFNDHSARFDHWSRRLVAEGFAVAAVDLRGHGRSEGRRGYARSYFDLIEDVKVLMARSRSLFPGLPLVLYGHSMGGNLVTNYLLTVKDIPVASVVTSPWFTLTIHPPLITMIGARFLRTFMPFVVVKSNIDAAGLSRDPAVVEAYVNDPLVHNLIQPNLFFAVEENGLRASRHIYKINIPLLVMHGSDDNITSVNQTRRFVQNAGNQTTYKEWPGCSHELHNDLQANEVFSYLTEWLNRQVKH